MSIQVTIKRRTPDNDSRTIMTPEPMNFKDELTLYHSSYARQARAATPSIAVLSLKGWRDEGRPTYDEYHGRLHQPKPVPQGQGDTMSDANTATTATETAKAAKAPRPPGAKALVRNIYTANPQGAFTIEELAAATGKPTSSITTAISDLKSSKYCKPGDPLTLHRHKDGKFSLVAEVVPAAPASTPPADALPV